MICINTVRNFSFRLLCLHLLLCVHDSQPASVPQVQLYEQKISQSNDTVYVRDVMRQAKAAEMRNYMQPEVDACDDFFQYACGNWAKINPTDARNVLETNFFALLVSTYNQKQLKVLTEAAHADDDAVTVQLKTFFDACRQLDDKQRERYKLKLWEVAEEFGQMPALMPEGTWEAGEFDWLATIARIQHKYGLDIILQLGMREDFVNKTVSKLFIGQPTLALQSRAMYKSQATKWHRDKYQEEIEQSLQKYLGIKEEVAKKTAREILYFESRLADGIMDRRLGKTLRSMAVLRTIDEMLAAYEGAIDVRAYMNISLGEALSDTFYEYHVEYQRNLVQMLKEIPKEQVANYVIYQLLKTFFFDYEATNSAKEKLCLDKTKLYFAKVLDNIIYRKYNSGSTVVDINLIWLKIREIFQEELESDSLKWISAMTRKVALEKLAAMRLEINSYETSKFAEEFKELALSHTDYIENIKQVLIHKTKQGLANLRQVPKPMEMPVALSISPAYIGKENLIKIPVMLLQPNFLWSDHYPHALKFATLGYLVAHELIHGFDDMGRNFDANGTEQSWWDNNSTEAFNERKKCFKRQYSLYRYNGKYLPPSELQAENIADNGGIQLAYSAYQKWLASLNDTALVGRKQLLALETLPNLNFTNHQLFFLAFAQYWCNDVDERYRDKVSLISIHAPAKYRVIGSLANFQSFAEKFQCASGTNMNPKRKCKIY
ncbi:neprilysin-1-like isoform X1 [Rhagoletis pomonella]|uniref:neprilysin-1-like isoform X1 n=2 Tax=Rhagoletis pomonella TaxID=28610 RepID=UPI00177FD259|nr:neprilysin-1-like isoform X1 [Rhagoletis pomonella]